MSNLDHFTLEISDPRHAELITQGIEEMTYDFTNVVARLGHPIVVNVSAENKGWEWTHPGEGWIKLSLDPALWDEPRLANGYPYFIPWKDAPPRKHKRRRRRWIRRQQRIRQAHIGLLARACLSHGCWHLVDWQHIIAENLQLIVARDIYGESEWKDPHRHATAGLFQKAYTPYAQEAPFNDEQVARFREILA